MSPWVIQTGSNTATVPMGPPVTTCSSPYDMVCSIAKWKRLFALNGVGREKEDPAGNRTPVSANLAAAP